MYRIILPKGRLVFTYEVMFVKGTELGMHTEQVDTADDIVFKTLSGE